MQLCLLLKFAKYASLLRHLGFAFIVGMACYLGLREDSCFFSITWIPRKYSVQIMHATMYRNFIGFGLLGIYVGFCFAKELRLHSKKGYWIFFGLLALPVIKELLQIPLPNRHATFMGTFHGVSGALLGVILGKSVFSLIYLFVINWKPNMNSQAPNQQISRTRLDLFDASDGLDRGKPKLYEAVWYLCKCFFFLSPLPWPSSLRCFLLRFFGAKVGAGVVIKPRVNIHFPWKLELCDHSWLGEEVFILNFEVVKIGSHVCISQRAFLCGGNHDFRDEKFRYRNAPITIEDEAWIGAQTFVAPGVTVGAGAVVSACSFVNQNLPPAMICAGNPCVAVKPRWKS